MDTYQDGRNPDQAEMGSDRTGENKTWNVNSKASKAATLAFNSDLRYNHGKNKLPVYTSASDRESFEMSQMRFGLRFGLRFDLIYLSLTPFPQEK